MQGLFDLNQKTFTSGVKNTSFCKSFKLSSVIILEILLKILSFFLLNLIEHNFCKVQEILLFFSMALIKNFFPSSNFPKIE